ncbi:hypothetical protein M446_3772 [Methylobacterium sp. 4-46]|uniref:hypothetical protein n=1 Tax=unclassified Methylobacterium TaxID=2615210 RepID=UPI000165C919|nr:MULTISPECIES: hypothetical protein [Methylobacterium]ACA18151.1 hypothetical protein M446_3772 [Methylobacterium sp. 4-46]WFT77449.1 hypothetical protein QA634_19125 [Methylobacterium nodulans]
MGIVEQRERAQQAWAFALEHLVSKGCDEAVALETMSEVAFQTYVDRHGSVATASYLRLLAQQVEEADREFAAALMQG